MRLLLIPIAFVVFMAYCSANKSSYNTDGCMMKYDSVFKRNLYIWSTQLPSMEDGMPIEEYFYYHFENTDTDDDWQASLHLAFIVDTTGDIKDAYILRKKEADYSTKDKAGLKLIRSLPLVKPGYCEGKKVPFLLQVSIRW